MVGSIVQEWSQESSPVTWMLVGVMLGLCALSVGLLRSYGHRFLLWLAIGWAARGVLHALAAWMPASDVTRVASLSVGLLGAGAFGLGFAAMFGAAGSHRRLCAWLPVGAAVAAAGLTAVLVDGSAYAARTLAMADGAMFGTAALLSSRAPIRERRLGRTVLGFAWVLCCADAAARVWMPVDLLELTGDPLLGPLGITSALTLGLALVIWVLEFELDLLQRAASTLQQWDREQFARQKAQTVRRMAGGVAHGFNNLLTSVLGHADLIEDLGRGNAEIQDSVGEIRRAVRRGATLTHQLLSVSSHRTDRTRPIDLDQRLAESTAALREVVGESVRLVLDQGAAGRKVQMPPAALDAILESVLANARDAMPAGGRVVISTHAEGDDVRLTIADDGTGMDAATLTQATDPFFTTKAVGKGEGLGLSTVRGLTEKYAGSMSLHSTPGEGTVVTFCWPRYEGHGLDALEDPAAEGPAPADCRILVVEDDGDIRELLRTHLGAAGYSVLTADDGTAALRVLAAVDHEVDLVLTDVAMPILDGTGLAQRIQRGPRPVPVRFISGYTRDTQRTADIEPEHLLAKPFSRRDLVAFVQQALRQAAARDIARR